MGGLHWGRGNPRVGRQLQEPPDTSTHTYVFTLHTRRRLLRRARSFSGG